MRLQREPHELRVADLRSTDEEVASLLVAAGQRNGDPGLVTRLQQQSEDWIAGLRLAALALPAGEDARAIAKRAPGHQDLMDFRTGPIASAG